MLGTTKNSTAKAARINCGELFPIHAANSHPVQAKINDNAPHAAIPPCPNWASLLVLINPIYRRPAELIVEETQRGTLLGLPMSAQMARTAAQSAQASQTIVNQLIDLQPVPTLAISSTFHWACSPENRPQELCLQHRPPRQARSRPGRSEIVKSSKYQKHPNE